MRKLAIEKLKLEDKMSMEDKMKYERHLNKRRSMEEPVKDDDSDSLDGPNDQEIASLLRSDSPTELTNGKGLFSIQLVIDNYLGSLRLNCPITIRQKAF